MRLSNTTALGWAATVLLIIHPVGCGPSTAGPESLTQYSIGQIGQLFHLYQKGQKPPPKGLQDILPLERALPGAVGSIKSKEVLIYWGAGLSDAPEAASTVLAYQKDVPEKGGEVLMQDGTAKKMTAAEFQSVRNRPVPPPKANSPRRKSRIGGRTMPRFASGMVPFAGDSHAARRPARHSSALAMLFLAAWCGLVAGWLEVGTRVLLKAMVPAGHLYIMSRHFAWVVPLSNLLFFLGVGLLLALTAKIYPLAAGWLGPRLLCAATLLPALMVVGPQVYTWAWLILALGISIASSRGSKPRRSTGIAVSFSPFPPC